MKILAIESSCDETAVAVIEAPSFAEASEGKYGNTIAVLSNVVSSQIAMHERYGGVVPTLAAREHAANIGHVYETALAQASEVTGHKLQSSDIDLLAVTRGPGLGPALLVGLTFARTLAWRYDKPLIGVDHMDGHIHSNWLSPIAEIKTQTSKIKKVEFPALNLIVSGGHTDLVLMRDHGDYKIIGETLDDAVGEAFDKVARLLGLSYPGGPKVSTLALQGNPTAYNLPKPMLKSPDFNFSYSGLKTAVLYLIRDITSGVRELTDTEKADIAASFQEAAIDVLIQKTRRAAEAHAVPTIMLSGGVSANTLLRERLTAMCADIGAHCIIPALEYTGDNAAMIAVAAYFAHQRVVVSDWQSVQMDANLRLGISSSTS
ncbi:MAG: tRNA (adenosine(37)-N6)-threonylcarbamoyltransferase complex transferase subunit TsaD [Patescibacteria group bacterium]